MRYLRSIMGAAVLALSIYIFSSSPLYELLVRLGEEKLEQGRMKNVVVEGQSTELSLSTAALSTFGTALSAQLPTSPAPDPEPSPSPQHPAPSLTPEGELILETTIEGALSIKNLTGYQVDMGKLLLQGPQITLSADQPQILIIHTHASEAYTPAGLDIYEASDDSRTEDTRYNIVRVGDELASVFEQAGLQVIHDREIYDYPSYTGSYNRSGQAVERWLAEYPGIGLVLDVHRDALGSNGIIYKTMAEEEGVCASQIMLLAGSDESGLSHPDWEKNLALAVYLQRAVSSRHPTLMRPVELVTQRYNQHLSPGALIVEVGSSGNTLQEALAAARLFASAAAPAIASLIESPEQTQLSYHS